MRKHYELKKKILILFIILSSVSFTQNNVGRIWVTIDDISMLPNENNDKIQSSSPALQSAINQYNITKISQALSYSKNTELLKVYEIECNCNSVELAQSINKIKGISNPEIAPEYELMYQPNDYNLAFPSDYALDIIKVKNAWDITKGDSTIIVGISDANFDVTSLELVGKFDYVSPNLTDPNINHGTAVAIEAAGNTDNGYGKSSVASNCRLRLYSMSYNSLLQACYDGVDVLNASWAASCGFSNYAQSVCDEIYNNGVVLIAAAGNGPTCGGAANYVYPASYNHVISVTSVGSTNNHQRISGNLNATHQHNDKVDISSPGYFVPVAIANGGFNTLNGTSFASPIVTGVAALILSVNPCLSVDQVEQILKQTSENIDDINPLYIGIIGSGRVDAEAAVLLAKQTNSISLSYTSDFICEKQIGSATIIPGNGFAPYSYNWTNGGDHQTEANLTAGSHSVIVTDSKGCKGVLDVVITGPTINYDYTSSVHITNPNFSLVDINNDGIIKVKGDIIIDRNVNYEINNKKIQFGYEQNNDFSGIIINSGATLNILNHTLLKGLSTCDSKWDGIIIKDNKYLSSTNETKSFWTNNSKGGRLNMNKSSINDANTAIRTPLSIANDSTAIYGTFNINNSVFYDNKYGLNVFSNKSLNISKNIISESIFLIEDSTLINPIHIQAENVDNLVILKNGFFGNSFTDVKKQGVAINAINSTLYISSDTLSDVSKIIPKANDFYNLTNGIISINTTGNIKPVEISGSYFSNVIQSISLNNSYDGLIYLNEFNQPSGLVDMKSFALNIENVNQLMITENNITTQHKEQQNVYGLILKNSQSGNIKIYKNKFDGIFTASNLFDGDNLNTTIDCNLYTGESTYKWLINSGKLKNQDGIDLEGKSLVYLNEFNEGNGKNSHIYIAPNAESIIYQTLAENMPKSFNDAFQPAIIKQNYKLNTCKGVFEKENYDSKGNVIQEKSISDTTETHTTLFPNPSNGNTLISWNGLEIDNINVFNSVGGLIFDKKVSGSTGSQSINNLSSGTYFVKLMLEDQIVKTEKLIVNH